MWEIIKRPDLEKLFATLPAAYFKNERWFADRAATIPIQCAASLLFAQPSFSQRILALCLFESGGWGYFYYIPLLIAPHPIKSDHEALFIENDYCFYDGIPSTEYISLLLQLLRENQRYTLGSNSFAFHSDLGKGHYPFYLKSSSSNSLLFVDQRLLIKNYRRIYPGINPELTITTALTALGSKITPATYGHFQFHSTYEYTLGIVQENIINQGTGWDILGEMLTNPTPQLESDLYHHALSLGDTIAELHQELSGFSIIDTAYEPLLLKEILVRVQSTSEALQTAASPLQDIARIATDKLNAFIANLVNTAHLGDSFLIHGDLHLEQVLKTETGWVVLDFEGEPLKPICHRHNCDSPLKDLAAMLRSMSYRVGSLITEPAQVENYEQILNNGLISGYMQGCQQRNAVFLPEPATSEFLLIFFQLERAVYECNYELQYRPDWFGIPFRGLQQLLQKLELEGARL